MSDGMESEAANKHIAVGVEIKDSDHGRPKAPDGESTSLPSPPSSVKASELYCDRNADGSMFEEVTGGGSSLGVHEGANTGIGKTTAPIDQQADWQIS